ncbi:MAG: CDP-alcohol phosphatidyltransferase family protein, partial [Muribaculaceae bacterium]|nr:CDP-alcohol phosphatidyltransferase family protein [Muribaculaceae bacterium]
MKLIRLIKQQIPNTITLLNLLSGCFAIVFAFRYNDTIGCLNAWQWTFVCIGLATIFDFCDGLSARLLHAYSAVGKELDSLADLISFGLAPAALAY